MATNPSKPKFGSPEWRAKYLGKGKKKPKPQSATSTPAMPMMKRGAKRTAKKSGKKNWIAGAIGKKNALHDALGVPHGQKIPLATLQAAAKRKDKVGKEARLALTLRGLNKGRA